jgi:hypothetical protein
MGPEECDWALMWVTGLCRVRKGFEEGEWSLRLVTGLCRERMVVRRVTLPEVSYWAL